ncbi:MAG: hypothetical protein KAX31_06645 [Thermoplasmata archaeon]|nr:hypothetical protein [Thermoplasmata archaeon]
MTLLLDEDLCLKGGARLPLSPVLRMLCRDIDLMGCIYKVGYGQRIRISIKTQ